MLPTHISAHTVVQLLQLAVDMAMSGIGQEAMQVPLQQVWPAAHITPPHVHCPLVQVAPLPQAMPHPPQLLMSESVNLHPTPGQQVWPVAHGAPDGKQPQCPPTQMLVESHLVPQPPQLSLSAVVSVHVLPQQVPPHCIGLSGQIPPPVPPSLPPLVPQALKATTKIQALITTPVTGTRAPTPPQSRRRTPEFPLRSALRP
jgi:hypothetical protein